MMDSPLLLYKRNSKTIKELKERAIKILKEYPQLNNVRWIQMEPNAE